MPTHTVLAKTTQLSAHKPVTTRSAAAGATAEETLRLGFCLTTPEVAEANLSPPQASHADQLPHHRVYMDRPAATRHFGGSDDQLDRVAQGLTELGFAIVGRDIEHRQIFVEAGWSTVETALHIDLYHVQVEGQTYRTYDGPIQLPEAIGSDIEEVTGLDTVPLVTPRLHSMSFSSEHFPVRRVAELYDFPLDQRGAGQTAVIIMLGGGFHRQDLDTYFSAIGLETPQVEVDLVGEATNSPASSETIQALFEAQHFDTAPVTRELSAESGGSSMLDAMWTVEATADIEVLGSLLPEAKIVVIFAANTQTEQAAAMQRALSSDFEATYGRPSVISCSWGQYEHTMRASSREAMDTHLEKATTLGVTVCCASGDTGGGFVYYPASNPHTLACGGTSILTPAETGDDEVREEVWRERRMNFFTASGGGLSSAFAAPDWQTSSVTPWGGAKRGLPDLAAQASANTGYALVIGDVRVGMGGTSLAAPLIAGLIGQINGANADLADDYRVGWLTPLLYRDDFCDAFVSIDKGSNGLYGAAAGWDPCTGLGRPIGSKLLELLRGNTKPTTA